VQCALHIGDELLCSKRTSGPFMAAELPDVVRGRLRAEKALPIAHQSLFAGRDSNHVGVVRHETIRPDFHLPVPTPLPHQINAGLVVLGAEERLLPPIPPLGDVVRDPRAYHPGDPCHGASVLFPHSRSRVQYGVPGIREIAAEGQNDPTSAAEGEEDGSRDRNGLMHRRLLHSHPTPACSQRATRAPRRHDNGHRARWL